jgi:hypothetical protein
VKRFPFVLLAALCFFSGCVAPNLETLGEKARGRQVLSYGYTPIDPLPAENVTTGDLSEFPDETMRLAIGSVSMDGSISYGPARIGGAGSNYVVTLDYIKYKTAPLYLGKVGSETATNSPTWTNWTAPSYRTKFQAGTNVYYLADSPALNIPGHRYIPANTIIPVYIGVGLRLTANITVTKGEVNLGNLFAVGAGVESGKVVGTLVIQTLGISGPSISAAIPVPGEVNPTTIQNALMAIGTIKSKIYDEETTKEPRVLALYNTLGGDTDTMNGLLSAWLESQFTPPRTEGQQGEGGR